MLFFSSLAKLDAYLARFHRLDFPY
jgi:hypothetical protein